jgi:hypothetical protein
MMLTILGFLGATMLPFRFNVFILMPAILFGWLLVLVSGLLTASSGSAIAFNMVLVAILLQFGYVAGIVLRWALLQSGLHRQRNWSDTPTVAPDDTF